MAKASRELPSVINRRKVITHGAVATAAAVTAVPIAIAAAPVFAPTELGRALLQQFPVHIAAVSRRAQLTPNDERTPEGEQILALVDATYEQCMVAVEAILARQHLVDMAIAARCFEWGNPDNDSHEAMTLALLTMAGIPESACNGENDAFEDPNVKRIKAARESVKAEAARIRDEAEVKIKALEDSALA